LIEGQTHDIKLDGNRQTRQDSRGGAATPRGTELSDRRRRRGRLASRSFPFAAFERFAVFRIPGQRKRIGFPQPSSKIDLLAPFATKRPKLELARVKQPLTGRAVDSSHKRLHRVFFSNQSNCSTPSAGTVTQRCQNRIRSHSPLAV
jgi:hypothetical protein